MTDRYAVLVLEDSPLWQNVVRLLLNAEKNNSGNEAYEVVSAISLVAALEELGRRVFDVAIVDINLNMMDANNVDGMAFLELLGLRYANYHTHAIVLSGQGTLQQAVDALKYPYVIEFLEKSHLDEDRLRAAVARGCMLARAGRERLLSVPDEETKE